NVFPTSENSILVSLFEGINQLAVLLRANIDGRVEWLVAYKLHVVVCQMQLRAVIQARFILRPLPFQWRSTFLFRVTADQKRNAGGRTYEQDQDTSHDSPQVCHRRTTGSAS